MQWIAILAITSVVYASTAMSAAALSCQPDLYGGCGDSSNSYCCDVGYCQPWNSGYYQCIDKPAKCPKQETDTDYYGNDIKAIYGIQPAQCCDECDKTPNCKAYTFVNQNPDGRTACYLKTSDAGRVGKKGAVSGALVDTPPPANCPTQEKGIDYFGNDIKTLFGGSETDCCDKCGTTTNCVAYTYIAQTSACYLKSSTAGRVAKDGAVSGKYKSGPPVSCPTQDIDFDYYGNDLKKLSGVTNDQCCDACSKTSDCAAYTYIASDSACYLKTSDAGKVEKIGAVSGKFKVAPPTDCPTQEIDFDYFGNDLKKLTGVTNGQCCDACSKTSGCAAYTYIASQSTCYLKKSSAGKVVKIGAVSGELTCPNVVMGQCGTSTTGALCCPAGSYCQPWNPGFYQCTPVPDVAKCPSVESDVDFFGGDLEVQYGLLPGGCCEACYNNAECKVYTFINYVPGGKSACYLKSKVVETRAKTGAISGYKVV